MNSNKNNSAMNDNKIPIGGRKQVKPHEIMMLQADVNYTVIHFLNGKKAIVATTLKELESRFEPFNFFRTHKSFMVNLDCIKHFLKPKNQLQMIDNKTIMISRRRMNGLIKCMIVK
jgi:DNA-binding LytR/AlgR family response regulator